MEVDYIIVGTGIAGVSLALELHAKGKRIVVYDSGEKITSSKIAAGIINPIVPKRITKTWMCDEVFPGIENYYRRWEKILAEEFYFPHDLFQIHATAQDSNAWTAKYESMEPYLQEKDPHFQDFISAPFGSTYVQYCGRLDVPKFCKTGIDYIANNHTFVPKFFKYSELKKGESGQWLYQDFISINIVFCEGIQAMNNPWFSYLPFIPSGGDIITVRIPALLGENKMFKQSTWLVPVKDDIFLAGSTFHQNSMDTIPQKTDASFLLKKLSQWLHTEIILLDHQRAVRPTVKNRRPFLGEHPNIPGLFIFNGLGTKGSSLVTWLAPAMADLLTEKKGLPAEVDIQHLK